MSNNGISRREFLAGAAAAGLVMGANALYPRILRAAEPKTGGHLKIGVNSGTSTNSLDPSHWGETFMVSLGFAIHGGLVCIGADGQLAPEAAESWEPVEGGKKWIFRLKKGITFSNGQSMTSEDVVNSLNFHRSDENASGGKAIFESVTDIKADGKENVIISLNAPIVDFPYMLTDHHLHIMPTKDGKMDWQSGIGAGPYILEDFQPGVHASFKRNPNSYRRSYLDSAELINIPDVVARQAALISGSVDVINRVDLKTADMLSKRNGVRVEDVPAKLHYWLVMNMNIQPFENYDVMQALKYSIDREEILKVIFSGHGSIGNDQPITPAYPYYNEQLAPKAYDPDKAKFHLKKAGHENLSFDYPISNSPFGGAVDLSVLWQRQAARAGININVQRVSDDSYDSIDSVNQPACHMNWWAGRATENTMLSVGFSESSPWNFSRWKNPEFNSLLAEARAEMDEAKRRERYYALQSIVSENSGVIIPIFANMVCALGEKVRHTENVSGEWDLDGGRSLERWWVA